MELKSGSHVFAQLHCRYPFNRTAYGIEIKMIRLICLRRFGLLIAPLMELK